MGVELYLLNIQKMYESSEDIEYLDYKRPPKAQRPIIIQSHLISILPIVLEWEGTKRTQQVRKIIKQQYRQPQLNTSVPKVKPKFNLVMEYKQYRIKAKIADFLTQKADVLLLPLVQDDSNQYPEIKQQLDNDIEQMKEKKVGKGSLYARSKKLLNYKIRAFVRIEQQFGVENLISSLNELIDLTLQKKISAKSIGFTLHDQKQLKKFIAQIGDIDFLDNDAKFEFILYLRSQQTFVELAKIVSSM